MREDVSAKPMQAAGQLQQRKEDAHQAAATQPGATHGTLFPPRLKTPAPLIRKNIVKLPDPFAPSDSAATTWPHVIAAYC